MTNDRLGNGEGSSTGVTNRIGVTVEHSLDETMRAPSTTTPDVVVLTQNYEETKPNDAANPPEDLWLSSSDGRFCSPIIPLRVGRPPNAEVFYVHKKVLATSEYFRKALWGDFREADAQSMDLPEEDPA